VELRAVVAAERLRAGQPIAAGQVRLETVTAAPAAGGAAQTLEEVIGRIPRVAVAAQSAVRRALLQDARDVVRGDRVRVAVERGGARLELEAQAEADGRRGDLISFRNPETKRRFLARIEGKGKAVAAPAGR